MDKEVLECVLKRLWKESSIQKVLSVETSPAVGKGQNFLSRVDRLNLKTILGDGRMANIGVILKDKAELEKREFEEAHRGFETEIKMYNTVITEMEYLMDEFEDTDDILWVHLIYHEPYKFMVVEDLKGLGLRMLDGKTFLDLEHCLVAVHSLARFHGMNKVLQERGVFSKDDYRRWFMFDDKGIHETFVWDIMAFSRAVKLYWDPKWHQVVSKINVTLEMVMERMHKLGELDETKFNVLNHGDCNKNNLFFKYDWQNRPYSMRFIDFQLPIYGSPCIDLTYLLHLGTHPSVRRENLQLLTKTYHDSLISTLDKFNFKGGKPSLEEIEEGMEKFSFLGLLLFLCWHPAICDPDRMDELFDREKIKVTDGKEGYSEEAFNRESFQEDYGPDIKIFADKYFLNVK